MFNENILTFKPIFPWSCCTVSKLIPADDRLLLYLDTEHIRLLLRDEHCRDIGICFSFLEGGKPVRLHVAALVHSTRDPYVPGHVGAGVASHELSEVSAKEGNMNNRESCQHHPEVRQPPLVPNVVVCYHTWHV